ncbi:hypothetical protein IWW38_003935 [Coemansia aciculifera]|uniref:Uncharacterized protein n=1 Tax=Coemansia aciculifera TaxID=417176 RepID=A0ACC1M0X7_9FUNG|nr:hypothetical protein IWW38_003935 [Coemansia aciculifera]
MTESGRLRYLYWRFNVLGVATLVVWNMYIVSSDFFRYEFRNTPFKDNFESVFSILSNSVNLAALCFALYTQPKADHDRRIKGGLLATTSVLGAIFLLSACGGEGWTALAISLLALCVAAVAAAYIQCSIFGIAASLPPCCAEGYMSGQAIAGTLASAAQLVAIYLDRHASLGELLGTRDKDNDSLSLALADDYWRLRLRTAVYFLVAAVFLVLSVVAWAQLNTQLALQPTVDVVQSQNGYARLDNGNATDIDEVGQLDSAGALATTMQEDSPRLARTNQAAFAGIDAGINTHLSSRTELQELALEDAHVPLPTTASIEPTSMAPGWLASLGLANAQLLYKTFAEISPYVLTCAVVMGQTLAVFPPLTEAVVSSPRSTPRIGNLTAWHFFVFNAGDYLGRLTTQWVRCSSTRVLYGANGARMLLIPAFLLFPTLATSPTAALVIHSDVLFLLLVLILGWSNGWVATAALIAGPAHASNKELAGSLLGFALCVGLVIGAVASYPILLMAGIS